MRVLHFSEPSLQGTATEQWPPNSHFTMQAVLRCSLANRPSNALGLNRVTHSKSINNTDKSKVVFNLTSMALFHHVSLQLAKQSENVQLYS